MIKRLLILTAIGSIALLSCKKELVDAAIAPVTTTSGITAPTGFKWENSRNLILSVGTTENKFPGKLYIVAIYASDPASGGKLLTKGSLTSTAKFKSKVYLSNQITELYIIFMAPDQTIKTKKVQAGTADLDINIGA